MSLPALFTTAHFQILQPQQNKALLCLNVPGRCWRREFVCIYTNTAPAVCRICTQSVSEGMWVHSWLFSIQALDGLCLCVCGFKCSPRVCVCRSKSIYASSLLHCYISNYTRNKNQNCLRRVLYCKSARLKAELHLVESWITFYAFFLMLFKLIVTSNVLFEFAKITWGLAR